MGVCVLLVSVMLLGVLTVQAVHPIQEKTIGASGIRYEAERAFQSVRDAVTSCNLAGLSAESYAVVNPESYITFTVNIPSDGIYPVTLSGRTCEVKGTILDIHANGLPLLEGSKLFFEDDATTHNLALRTGLNTITYTVHGVSVAFDWISIKGANAMALQGATLPFQEIEAENANYQGTLIGPGRAYYTLPSEASGRKAVQLTKEGDYVEFTPTQPFNAFVIRLSIPDSSSGSGQTAILNVLINGKQTTALNVTSYFSWVYGGYPYTKNPSDGKPHHFYDDTRYMFGSSPYPAGTKIRFAGGSAAQYTIDLAEFFSVPAAYTRPANYLSVEDYGADPTGQKDSIGAFNNARDAAFEGGKGVWIPEGKFHLSSQVWSVNKITIRGAGPWYTELHGQDIGFYGNNPPTGSSNVGFYDFAVFGMSRVRQDSALSSGVGGALTNSIVQNLWIEHNKCGIWVDGPFDSLHITGVRISNTFADGINLHQAISNTLVEQTFIRNTGDDAVAMWAQSPGTYQKNVVQFNTLSLPLLANTIAIYGGSDNSATDNLCTDTVADGAGFEVGTRYGSVQLSGTTTFARNSLIHCGSPNVDDASSKGEGAIWIYSDNGPITTGSVVFQSITIEDAYYSAIMFYQGQVSNINFDGVQVTGASYVFEERVSGSASAQNVVAKNITQAGIWNCGASFTITQGPGNSGWSSTKCIN